MKEERLQYECVIWFNNEYPYLRGLLYANNNNSHNAIKGALNRSMGVISGVADMTFLYKKTTTFLEFKTKIGKQSKKQIDWEKVVTFHNFDYHIIRSFDQFTNIIKNICK